MVDFDGTSLKQRCIVIADCHGSPHLIGNALDHADYKKDVDRLVFAGDFLDIGKSPGDCWRFLKQNDAEMLWGNHELAIVLGQQIGPQDAVSWDFLNPLRANMDQFSIAADHDCVLITHAGLSSKFDKEYQGMSAHEIALELNDGRELGEWWSMDSPVWFRPIKTEPYHGLVQVVGHTPQSYIEHIPDFHVIDPWSPISFGKDRYRYAVIENNTVTVHDSVMDDLIRRIIR